MSEKTKNWAAFGSEYLKAIDVLNNTDEYVIVGVDSKFENNKETLILDVARGDLKKKFGCNKTNGYAVQEACPNSPEDAVERVITFNKVKVQKPGTDEIVDGLRLVFKPLEITESDKVDSEDAGLDDDGLM